MGKKNFYLVLDTETSTLPWVKDYSESVRDELAIAKPLVYDIGWKVIDTQGNEYLSKNYLVQETFFAPAIMELAYYANKRPLYTEMFQRGEITNKLWNDIITELIADAKDCKAVCAYNAAFDFKKAIPFTERFINALYGDYKEFERKQRYSCEMCEKEGKVKSKNPKYLSPEWEIRNEVFPIIDLWDVACKRLINIDKYRKYCINNRLWSNSVQYFKTSAETAFQYLANQHDFEESHTALDDAKIEGEILAKALKRGKVEPCMGAFPFRELGTTVDFVREKYPSGRNAVRNALEAYTSECERKGSYSNSYITKLYNLTGQLMFL
jgi:hypothetical protein